MTKRKKKLFIEFFINLLWQRSATILKTLPAQKSNWYFYYINFTMKLSIKIQLMQFENLLIS